MKTFRRKIPARTVVRYQCEICEANYRTPAQAERCEARIVEAEKFIPGQLVRAVWQPECSRGGPYCSKGKVVKSIGPQLPEEDYARRCLGGKTARLNSHVFQYEILFICPHCKQNQSALYYASELKTA